MELKKVSPPSKKKVEVPVIEESEGSGSDESSGEEDDSDSETTITDSGEESHHHNKSLKPLRLSHETTSQQEPLQSPLDIFLSAAEALSNTIPPEVALHDHTYAKPPLDTHATSGLQLIAAAAAVVSPGLSKSAGKNPLSLSVKAPRGRPPNQQKRGTTSSQKLAPSILTPTSGVGLTVPLQDCKSSTLRGRSRSAPTDKGRPVHSSKPLSPSIFSVKAPAKAGSNGGSQQKTKDYPNIIPSGLLKSYTNTSNGTQGVTLDSTQDTPRSNAMPPVTTSKSMSQRKDSPVFELNIGSMALLLNNQQAALLLPQSTIFNKHTLAVLQQGGSATLNIDPAALSRSTGSAKTGTVTTRNGSTGNEQIPLINLTLPTTQLTTPPTATTKRKDSASDGKATPTADDLSNLNMLSNLVAGMTPSTSSSATPSYSSNSVSSNSHSSSKPSSLVFRSQADTTSKQQKKPSSLIESKDRGSTAYPSLNQQSLMLYARSLSMPSSKVEKGSGSNSPDDNDHLEYATRGISELSKLLGGSDNGLESPANENTPISHDGKHWTPDELLCNPFDPTLSQKTITSSLTTADTSSHNMTHHKLINIHEPDRTQT